MHNLYLRVPKTKHMYFSALPRMTYEAHKSALISNIFEKKLLARFAILHAL